MTNVPLLRKVLEYITENQHTWMQDSYALLFNKSTAQWRAEQFNVPVSECGSAFCVAGHVANMAGKLRACGTTFIMKDNNDSPVVDYQIHSFAQRELDLTTDQANELFWAHQTLWDLWRLAEEFTDGEITIPDDVTQEVDHDCY